MMIVRSFIQSSPIHGTGIFAAEDIKEGQVVWEFNPHIDIRVPTDKALELPPAAQEFLSTYAYEEMYEGQRVLVISSDHSKYMNHADGPNLIQLDRHRDCAARDIKAGEELTCNYYSFDLAAAEKLGGNAPD